MPGGRIDHKGHLSKNLNSARDLSPGFTDLDILKATPDLEPRTRQKRKARKSIKFRTLSRLCVEFFL